MSAVRCTCEWEDEESEDGEEVVCTLLEDSRYPMHGRSQAVDGSAELGE